MIYEIYALCDPDNGEIRYIGKANNSAKRYAQHLREKRRDYPVYRWIKKLAVNNKAPALKILETTGDWKEAEIRLIEQYKGNRLLNVAKGGDQPECTKEVRAANGKKVAESIHSDPRRKKIWDLKRSVGIALKKGYVNESSKDKLREAAKKAPHIFGEFASI